MNNAAREKLVWLLFESLLIVISILLAFWVDAWWDRKQEERDQRETIEAILGEFHGWQDAVASARPMLTAIRDSADKLIHESLKAQPSFSSEELDSLLADFLWPVNASIFSAPVLEAAIAGGELQKLTNPELRRALVVWSIRFKSMERQAAESRNFYSRQFMPFLNAQTSVLQIRNAVKHVPGRPERTENVGEIEPYRILSPTDHTHLLSNREFQNLLLGMGGSIYDLLWYTRDAVSSELTDTMFELEEELAALRETK